MIDRITAIAAPSSAQSGSANASSAALPGNGNETPGFAGVLARSAAQAGARSEAAGTSRQASVVPKPVPEEDTEMASEASPADAAAGVDLAVLIALVSAESPPILPPVAGEPSLDTRGIVKDESFASAARAGSVPLGGEPVGGVPFGAVASGPVADRTADERGSIVLEASGPADLPARAPSSEFADYIPETAKATETSRSGNAPVAAALSGAVAAVGAGTEAAVRAPSADSPDYIPESAKATETSRSGNVPAAAAVTGAIAARASRAPAAGAAASPSPGLIREPTAPPAPPAAAIAQAAGGDPATGFAPAAAAAGHADRAEGPAAHLAGGPVAAPARVAELPGAGVSRKIVEPYVPAAYQAEATPAANVAGAAVAQAGLALSPPATGLAANVLVPAHVESPAWSLDFGRHVIRLAVEGQPAAEIHLNPPEWGPIRVSIEIKGQDATLHFVAEHPQTRAALEGALPRLHEMFAAESLTLCGANVTDQASAQHSPGSQGQRFDQPPVAAESRRSAALEDPVPVAIAVSRPAAGRSRVDLFA